MENKGLSCSRARPTPSDGNPFKPLPPVGSDDVPHKLVDASLLLMERPWRPVKRDDPAAALSAGPKRLSTIWALSRPWMLIKGSWETKLLCGSTTSYRCVETGLTRPMTSLTPPLTEWLCAGCLLCSRNSTAASRRKLLGPLAWPVGRCKLSAWKHRRQTHLAP